MVWETRRLNLKKIWQWWGRKRTGEQIPKLVSLYLLLTLNHTYDSRFRATQLKTKDMNRDQSYCPRNRVFGSCTSKIINCMIKQNRQIFITEKLQNPVSTINIYNVQDIIQYYKIFKNQENGIHSQQRKENILPVNQEWKSQE